MLFNDEALIKIFEESNKTSFTTEEIVCIIKNTKKEYLPK